MVYCVQYIYGGYTCNYFAHAFPVGKLLVVLAMALSIAAQSSEHPHCKYTHTTACMQTYQLASVLGMCTHACTLYCVYLKICNNP